MATASRPGQLAAVTKPTRPACRVFRSRPLRSRGLVLAGIGVKGDTGGRTRSAARRASTERVRMSGEAFTLDADGGHRAYRQGGVKGTARSACPCRQSGKNRRGMQPKRLPKRSAEGFPLATDWRDRGRSVVAKKKPRRSGVREVSKGFSGALALQVFNHVLLVCRLPTARRPGRSCWCRSATLYLIWV